MGEIRIAETNEKITVEEVMKKKKKRTREGKSTTLIVKE